MPSSYSQISYSTLNVGIQNEIPITRTRVGELLLLFLSLNISYTFRYIRVYNNNSSKYSISILKRCVDNDTPCRWYSLFLSTGFYSSIADEQVDRQGKWYMKLRGIIIKRFAFTRMPTTWLRTRYTTTVYRRPCSAELQTDEIT